MCKTSNGQPISYDFGCAETLDTRSGSWIASRWRLPFGAHLIREDRESAQCCAHATHTRQDRCQASIRTTPWPSAQTTHTSCEENNSIMVRVHWGPSSRRLPIVFESHGPPADRPQRARTTYRLSISDGKPQTGHLGGHVRSREWSHPSDAIPNEPSWTPHAHICSWCVPR